MSRAASNTLDKSSRRVQRMFASIAHRYDLMNHLLSLDVDRYWRWKTARLAQGLSGYLLDVCTGTGDLALALVRRAAPSAEVWGVDFCRPMLQLARKKIVQRGLQNRIRLIEGDALKLPFADGHFTLVTIAFGLRNLSDTDAGLRELYRVCASGGRVAVLEFSQPHWKPWAIIYGWYFRNLLPRLGQWLARNPETAYQYLPESVGQFPSGQALVDRMHNVGWETVSMQPMTGGVVTLYVGTKPHTTA
jgi:demethylmenaquinone methyltransferase/2-methoxy-6-polyprenyl-1,4-benzoquinol methylase